MERNCLPTEGGVFDRADSPENSAAGEVSTTRQQNLRVVVQHAANRLRQGNEAA